MSDSAPFWARWQATRTDASPWATVTLRGAHGPVSARLMSIGRGWLSVLHQNRAEVWPPAQVDWARSSLLPSCLGIEVELVDGTVHELAREAAGDARIWSWVRRACQVGATVEGKVGAPVPAPAPVPEPEPVDPWVETPGAWLVKTGRESARLRSALRTSNPAHLSWRGHGKGQEPDPWVYPYGELGAGERLGMAWFPRGARDWKPAPMTRRKVPRALASGVAPFDYQASAVAAVLSAGHGIVEAPCGAGKTAIGTFLAAEVDGRCLVLVHTLDLLRQWVDRLQTWLPGVDVGQLGGGKDQQGAEIVVASLSTLARWSWDELERLGARFGLLVCDECHHVPATTWLRVVSGIAARHRVGLTATPKRRDGLETWMSMALGPTVFQIDQTTLDQTGRTMAPEIRVVRTGHDVQVQEHAAATMRGVLEDHDRHRLTLAVVRALASDKRTILVLTTLVDHAQTLAFDVGGVALVGSVPAKKRTKALEDVRAGRVRVLVATQLADEGLDLPQLDAVVLTAPTSHKPATRQRIGRACRSLPGKRTPVVVDLVDDGQWAARKWSARRSLYGDLNWTHEEWKL